MDKLKLTAEDIARINRIFKAEGCKPIIEGSAKLVPSKDFEGETSLQFRINGVQTEGSHANKVLFKNHINQRPSDLTQANPGGYFTDENRVFMEAGVAVCEIAIAPEGGLWKEEEPPVNL